MPHNFTFITFKDNPFGAAVISRIKNTKGDIKNCVDYKCYRTKKSIIQNITREVLVVNDK